MWMRTVLVVGLLCLAACERPEAKAQRLLQAKLLACGRVQSIGGLDSVVLAAHAQCDAATREYNQFVAGR